MTPSDTPPRTPARARDIAWDRLGDHLDRLYRAAWALCGSREDAEDLVQETCARVLARRRALRHADDLGYLLQALRNTHIDGLRAARARVSADELPGEDTLAGGPADGHPERMAEASEVFAAVAGLPPPFRDVLVAVDVAGLSYREAARLLDIREGTVMSRLHRARERVVRAIDGEPRVASRE